MMTVWKMNGNRSIIVAVLNVPMLKDLILKCGSPVAPRPFHALISRLAGWWLACTAGFTPAGSTPAGSKPAGSTPAGSTHS